MSWGLPPRRHPTRRWNESACGSGKKHLNPYSIGMRRLLANCAYPADFSDAAETTYAARPEKPVPLRERNRQPLYEHARISGTVGWCSEEMAAVRIGQWYVRLSGYSGNVHKLMGRRIEVFPVRYDGYELSAVLAA